MNIFYSDSSSLKEIIPQMNAGDTVYLSGTVYTARDAAHKRISTLLSENNELPFKIENASIYYAGPTPTPDNLPIGSCGPTTSVRMDPYTPSLYDMGLTCTIGKGERSKEVIEAIIRNKSVYLCAIGGCGALAAKCIKTCEIIAFEDLGCESVKKLEFNNFPLIVAIDSKGNSIFK